MNHDAPITGVIAVPIVSPATGERVTEEVAAEAKNSRGSGAIDMLDLPLTQKRGRGKAPIDSTMADQLLGSVLESLPEPSAPGTRKRASRRVSSGTITTAHTTAEESSAQS
jgi:ribonuclease E